MDFLQQFSIYIKEEKFNQVLQGSNNLCDATAFHEFKNFSISDQNDLCAFMKRQLMEMIDAIENSEIETYLTNLASYWQQKATKEFPFNKINGPAVIFLISAQKKALVQLVSSFTNHLQTAIDLTNDLDALFCQIQIIILKALEKERENEQRQLSETRERYKDLFDHAHDMIHVVELDGTILYVNNSWQKVLGYASEEIQGKSIYSFVSPGHRNEFKLRREKIVEGAEPEKEMIVEMLTKEGRTIVLEGFISVKRNRHIPLYTRGIFRDITARVESDRKVQSINQALKEREENLYRLVTFAPDAIVAIDEESNVTYWNPKAVEIFGWTPEEVLGKPLSQIIIPPVHREAHTKGMKRYLSTGEAQVLNRTVEVTALNKKGEEFYISLTISTFKQEGIKGFVSFIRDITEQKRNLLELEQKRRELEESNKELEQYAWLTSHDLREPLRKILTFSDIILTKYEHEISEKVKNYTKKINDSGTRMSYLIQAILSYTRLNHDKNIFEATNLNVVAGNVLVDMELLIKETNARVLINHLPTIDAIEFQMHQLLQNLISNALKYRRKDLDPVVEINAQIIDDWVDITFQDNGKGFLIKNRDVIFRLFERIDAAGEGMGIGLALCKKIVEIHHGQISVNSQPNMGTTFIVRLPVHQNNTSH